MNAFRLRLEESRIIDHCRTFRHGNDSVIVVHTYASEEEVRGDLSRACEMLSKASRSWRSVTVEIDQRFNLYCPEVGAGFEIRRPSKVRAPWRVVA